MRPLSRVESRQRDRAVQAGGADGTSWQREKIEFPLWRPQITCELVCLTRESSRTLLGESRERGYSLSRGLVRLESSSSEPAFRAFRGVLRGILREGRRNCERGKSRSGLVVDVVQFIGVDVRLWKDD